MVERREKLKHEQVSQEPLRYPKELVEKYGAKAGILLYVAKYLPHIPQASMIVNEKNESTEDFLKRADGVGLGWPRFFRSSAIAELVGYEGDFPTEEVESFEEGHERVKWNKNNYSLFRNKEYFNDYIKALIERIKNSPKYLKESGKGKDLPDVINVIIAERSSSNYFGTFIKHPNQENTYLIALTKANTQNSPRQSADNPQRSAYKYKVGQGVSFLDKFSVDKIKEPLILQEIEEVCSWHDQICSLPEMDPSWAYQIEFGLDPLCLYQVRPLKPQMKADFQIERNTFEEDDIPLVFGTTTKEGALVRVEVDPSQAIFDHKEVNKDNQPTLSFENLRQSIWLDEVPNNKVVILYNAFGFLAHNDIKVMRQADVVMYYSGKPFNLLLKQGEWIKVVSDGSNVQMTRVS